MDLVTLLWTAALGAVLLAWGVIAACLALTELRTPLLEPPGAGSGETEADRAGWPPVTVVVPARNEAAHVERTVRSLLAQHYPALEVIAVDDRSEDGTGAVLQRLAAEHPRLRVLHVRELPPGWLGKNHASHLAAAQATGDWLLFTDADVVFAPGALAAALAFARRHGLGHLVAGPHLVAPGYWECAIQATFAIYLVLRLRLWALRRPGSRAYVGVGAFNLVRRADYERVGGHRRLAMEVVDDMKLGLLLRRSGVPQALAGGAAFLSVRWLPGFWASLRGLLKNLFADAEFRWGPTLGRVAGLLVLGVLPGVGLLLAPGWTCRALALAGLVLPMLLLGGSARRSAGGSGLEGLAAPLMHLALAGAVLLSALLATLRGGLAWRGTFYSLAALRAGLLRARDLPRRNAVGW